MHDDDNNVNSEIFGLPAFLSSCRRWRYLFTRPAAGLLGSRGPAMFVMHNPSVADEVRLDPTVRRCIGYATRWGCTAAWVVNRFAVVGTDPDVVFRSDNPVGPLNDAVITAAAQHVTARHGIVVASWGVFGKTAGQKAAISARTERVVSLIRDAGATLCALAVTRDGVPRHPLYLRADLEPIPWTMTEHTDAR